DLKAGLMLTDIFDPDSPAMSMYGEGLMVLEVKFNRYLPEFIRCVLNNVNAAERSAISKYIICRKYD
ncbi:MAG: transporter, partial [Eubacteriales bacterium]|nr:transporter [Eubacteriales bacterium]